MMAYPNEGARSAAFSFWSFACQPPLFIMIHNNNNNNNINNNPNPPITPSIKKSKKNKNQASMEISPCMHHALPRASLLGTSLFRAT